MSAKIIRIPRRFKPGTEIVYKSIANRGLKTFNWRVSSQMASILTELSSIRCERKTNLITEACSAFYSGGYDFDLYGEPSLVVPTEIRGICTPWYSPVILNEEMKALANLMGGTMQELVDHAVWNWHSLPRPEH